MEMGKNVHLEVNGCIGCFGSPLTLTQLFQLSEAAACEADAYIKQLLTLSQYLDSP